jgi:hypothetical protein
MSANSSSYLLVVLNITSLPCSLHAIGNVIFAFLHLLNIILKNRCPSLQLLLSSYQLPLPFYQPSFFISQNAPTIDGFRRFSILIMTFCANETLKFPKFDVCW